MQRSAIHRVFRTISFVFASACTLGSITAHAQTGVLTQDLKTEMETHAQTIKQIAQYAKQGQQYMTQLQQYQQMLTKVENLGSHFELLPNSLEEIDAGPLIAASCGGGNVSIAGNLLNHVTSLIDQSTNKSQQAICGQTITVQVEKYNYTVEILNTINANTAALNRLIAITNNFTSPGQSSSATTQAEGYRTEMETAITDWSSHIKADEEIISSLNDMQSVLARQAMNAKTNMTGEAVQAAVLTTAFTYHPSL